MKEITRYAINGQDGTLEEHSHGAWCSYTDFATIKERADRLEKALRKLCDVVDATGKSSHHSQWSELRSARRAGLDLLTSNTEDKGV